MSIESCMAECQQPLFPWYVVVVLLVIFVILLVSLSNSLTRAGQQFWAFIANALTVFAMFVGIVILLAGTAVSVKVFGFNQNECNERCIPGYKSLHPQIYKKDE